MTRRVRYVLVLIDFQAEHTPEIQNSERVVARAIALASAARRAGVRCVGIETQAVSGGPLIANIRLRSDDVMGSEALAGINADRLILAGCETHGAVLAAIPEAAFAMMASCVPRFRQRQSCHADRRRQPQGYRHRRRRFPRGQGDPLQTSLGRGLETLRAPV